MKWELVFSKLIVFCSYCCLEPSLSVRILYRFLVMVCIHLIWVRFVGIRSKSLYILFVLSRCHLCVSRIGLMAKQRLFSTSLNTKPCRNLQHLIPMVISFQFVLVVFRWSPEVKRMIHILWKEFSFITFKWEVPEIPAFPGEEN